MKVSRTKNENDTNVDKDTEIKDTVKLENLDDDEADIIVLGEHLKNPEVSAFIATKVYLSIMSCKFLQIRWTC